METKAKFFFDALGEGEGEGEGEWEGQPLGGCPAARAACKPGDSVELALIRRYRDVILLKSPFGKAVFRTYWRVGPTISRFIARSIILRRAFFWAFVRPASLLAKYHLSCHYRAKYAGWKQSFSGKPAAS
ncbi:hypothetical protein ACFL1X_13770 [Candidatus Hydrogenedentota bacterium]